MNFRQAENKVKIEGILSETDLKYGSFVKNGETIESIGGTIKILVEKDGAAPLEIPVHMFSTKRTRAGGINPAYESIEKVMKDFVSIAAAGDVAKADRVRITSGNIRMNEFIGQNDQLVSQPRIHASFVSKVTGEFRPEASFSAEFMVSNIERVVDKDGVEVDPAKLRVQVIIPQYTAPTADVMNVDLVTFYATAPSVISAIETYWEAGGCYRANGHLNFSSRSEEVIEEVDFGEAQRKVRTISVSEFLIAGGSQDPLDGDFAFSIEDIKAGMAARKQRLEDMKNNRSVAKNTPAPSTSKGKTDLGF